MEHGGRHCGWDTRKAVAGGGTVLDGETGKGMSPLIPVPYALTLEKPEAVGGEGE